MSAARGHYARLVARQAPPICIFGVLLATIGAKFRLILAYGSDVPLSDQWYGELVSLYAPLVRGEFGFAELFAGHNEHRIVLTRLLDLALLWLNGQWDPRLQLLVNCAVVVGALGVWLFCLSRNQTALQFALSAGCAALFFGSVSLWENALNGFQSQFYFCLLACFLHLALTLHSTAYTWRWWCGHLAGLGALFSIAPGVLSALTILAVLGWRRFLARQPAPGEGVTAAWNLALAALAVAMLPTLAPSADAQAATVFSRAEALLHVLSWPVADWKIGLLIWAPGLLWLLCAAIRPRDVRFAGWLLPWLLLALGFCLAIALGRGGVASRYGDLIALGPLANLACLLNWPAQGRRALLVACLGTVWAVAVVSGLQAQESAAQRHILAQAVGRHEELAVAARQFVTQNDDTAMRRSSEFTGWNVADFTRELVRPEVQAILPLSIRPALPIGTTPAVVVAPGQVPAEIAHLPILRATRGEWRGEWIRAQLPLLSVNVLGRIVPPESQLWLETDDGRTISPLQPRLDSPDRWQRLNFPSPAGRFRLVARVQVEPASFSFTAPRELGRLSWLAPKILPLGRGLHLLGWVTIAAVGIAALAAWLLDESKPSAPAERPTTAE